MSTALKKTPKKENEQPRQATPIRAHLARAVSLQARKNTPHPEEKKHVKKSTPRKPRTETKDNKQITLSESDAESTDDGEAAAVEEMKEEDTKGEVKSKDNDETKEEEDPKVDNLILKETKEAPVVEQSETSVEIKVVKHETTETAKDKTPSELREQALLQRYNELWEAENQLREQVAEREKRRRAQASRRIDREYQRRISEIYEGPQSIKHESDSDEEEDSAVETRITKLEEKVAQLQESLQEKERIIDSLQKAPTDVLKHPIVLQTLQQLTDKQQYEEETFTAGQKALEIRMRKLQQENEQLKEEKLRLEAQAEERLRVVECVSEALEAETFRLDLREKELGVLEEVKTQKQQTEQQALEKEKEFAAEVARAAQDMVKKMAERKRLKNAQQAQGVNRQEPVALQQVAQENEEHTQNDEASSQENAEYSQENLDTTEEHEDEGEEENNEPEEQYENGEYPEEEGTEYPNSEIDPAADSIEREHDAGRKRRRLDDDEDGAQQFELGDTEATDNENGGNAGINGPAEGNAVTKVYRRLIKPYARRGLGVVTACSVFGAVHLANQYAQYVPGI